MIWMKKVVFHFSNKLESRKQDSDPSKPCRRPLTLVKEHHYSSSSESTGSSDIAWNCSFAWIPRCIFRWTNQNSIYYSLWKLLTTIAIKFKSVVHFLQFIYVILHIILEYSEVNILLSLESTGIWLVLRLVLSYIQLFMCLNYFVTSRVSEWGNKIGLCAYVCVCVCLSV